jgi:hypothetical protein
MDDIINQLGKVKLNDEEKPDDDKKPIVEEIKDNKSNIKEKNIWIPWTDKSKDILFEHPKTPGEDKVAAELNTRAKGQNSTYDMNATINNNQVKCEIKKLDNNTFNTGATGRKLLRPILYLIMHILDICNKINNSSILTPKEKEKISYVKDLDPGELTNRKIQEIKEVCEIFSKKQELRKSLPKVTPFEKKGEPLEMSLDEYYDICLRLKQPISPEYESYTDKLIFLHEISHVYNKYISNPSLIMDDLNSLVSLFNELQLIFVDKKKGYYIWDKIDCIKFQRITRGGYPRFKVHSQI